MNARHSGKQRNDPKACKVRWPIQEGFQPRPDNIKGYQPLASTSALDTNNPPGDFTAVVPVPAPKPNSAATANPRSDGAKKG